MGTTPIYGFPYPDPSDLVANYPALGQQLAEDVEDAIVDSGGFVHINTTTFSAVGSVNINTVFSSTYDNYEILIYVTADTPLSARMRLAGTDNTTSNYAFQSGFFDNTTAVGERQTAQTAFRIANSNSAGLTTPVRVTFFDPAKAAPTQYLLATMRNLTTPILISTGGVHNVSTAYDGISLFPASGNITGTVRIYGYKNS